MHQNAGRLLFIGKNVFFEKKAHFFGNKIVDLVPILICSRLHTEGPALKFLSPPLNIRATPIPTTTTTTRTSPSVYNITPTTKRPFKDYNVIEYDFTSNYEEEEEDEENKDTTTKDEGIQYILDYSDYLEAPPPSASLKKNLYRHILTPEDDFNSSPYVVDLTKKNSHGRGK